MTIRNPFRNQVLRATFDAVIYCYQIQHKDIWRPPGHSRPGNAWSNNFWRGYDGVYTCLSGTVVHATPLDTHVLGPANWFVWMKTSGAYDAAAKDGFGEFALTNEALRNV